MAAASIEEPNGTALTAVAATFAPELCDGKANDCSNPILAEGSACAGGSAFCCNGGCQQCCLASQCGAGSWTCPTTTYTCTCGAGSGVVCNGECCGRLDFYCGSANCMCDGIVCGMTSLSCYATGDCCTPDDCGGAGWRCIAHVCEQL